MAINFATGGTQVRPAGITNNEYYQAYESRWYFNGASGAWRIGPGALGNGTINLTSTDTSSRHLVTVNMNFGQVDTWTQGAFLVQYQIGNSGWVSLNGAGAIMYLGGRNGAHNTATLQRLWHPNTTTNVQYRILFTSQNSGDYVRLNYGNLNSGSDDTSEQFPYSSVLIQEYRVP